MKVVMVTNTYLPHVGGVARSVQRFSEGLRRRGHEVLIVAPEFKNQPPEEQDVLRVPAILGVGDGSFSLAVPLALDLRKAIEQFAPDLLHAHHPYLLGDTAARLAAALQRPLVFTHHTMYEHYTHYAPLELPGMGRYVAELATGFANLCQCVIAPSQSAAEILRSRGVTAPIEVLPTGVDTRAYAEGDGPAARRRFGVPPETPLIGHVSRLCPEKNEEFLARAMAQAAQADGAACLVVGQGPSRQRFIDIFAEAGVDDRAVFPGVLQKQELIDAYHAMDVMAFASKTETQGMVLVEAMAAGTPVVALDAPGAREIVRDDRNGRLVRHERVGAFAAALVEVAEASGAAQKRLGREARHTAASFDSARCVERLEQVYRKVVGRAERACLDLDEWEKALQALRREGEIWANRFEGLRSAISGESPNERTEPHHPV